MAADGGCAPPEIMGLGAYGHEGAYAREMQVIQIHAASALPPPQCR
jgi:hypothetical protein